MEQENLRIRLNGLVSDYGSTLAFISRRTNIEQSELTKFRNNRLSLNPSQAERLDNFLCARGYSDNLKAFTAVVQGNFC